MLAFATEFSSGHAEKHFLRFPDTARGGPQVSLFIERQGSHSLVGKATNSDDHASLQGRRPINTDQLLGFIGGSPDLAIRCFCKSRGAQVSEFQSFDFTEAFLAGDPSDKRILSCDPQGSSPVGQYSAAVDLGLDRDLLPPFSVKMSQSPSHAGPQRAVPIPGKLHHATVRETVTRYVVPDMSTFEEAGAPGIKPDPKAAIRRCGKTRNEGRSQWFF